MRKTYKYRLYTSKRNKHLVGIIKASASIYNHCIALHKRYYRMFSKHLNKYQLMKHIAKIRKKKAYWQQVPSQSVQDIASRIDKAYKLFFSNLKKGVKCSPPNFKKSAKYKSFTLKQAGWKLVGENKIKIGKHHFKFVLSRPISGKIQTVTVKRDSCGDLFLLFSCKDVPKNRVYAPTGKSVGIDVGLKTFLSLSNGRKVNSPTFFSKIADKLKKANQNLARKVKGSNNWVKAKKKLAKIYRSIANKRDDFQWKLANELVMNYDNLFFETLNFKGMQKLWGRKIGDLGIYGFLQKIEFVCSQHSNKFFGKIDKWFPSTKLCFDCGDKNNDLTLKDRIWTCPNCNGKHDRDINAAKNILKEGARTFAPDLVAVRPLL